MMMLTDQELQSLRNMGNEAERAADEIAELRTTLAMVADIAHSGGLDHHNDATALIAIQRLTLSAWNPFAPVSEERVRQIVREELQRLNPGGFRCG